MSKMRDSSVFVPYIVFRVFYLLALLCANNILSVFPVIICRVLVSLEFMEMASTAFGLS